MRRNLLVLVASFAGLALLIMLVPPLRDSIGHALSGDTKALQREFDGIAGLLTLVVITQAHAIIFYPTEIVTVAGGYVYGFWFGFPLLLVLWTVSGLTGYALGHTIGRPIAVKLFGEDRVRSAEGLIDRGGVPVLIGARLIPIVPYALFSYVAGAARVPLWRYTWTSFIGYAPLTAVVVLLGHRLEHLSLTDPLLWGACIVIVALVALAHPLGRRLNRPSE